MFVATVRRFVWLGGTAANASLGLDLRPPSGQFVNIVPEGTQPRGVAAHTSNNITPSAGSLAAAFYAHQPERRYLADTAALSTLSRRAPVAHAAMSKWQRGLRADIYDELLKLPLRFSLHDFGVLQRHVTRWGAESDERQSADPPLPSGVFKMPYSSTTAAAAGANDGAMAETADGGQLAEYYAIAGRDSAVGYAAPLGPADPLDVLPFFVHRGSNGQLPGKVHSLHAKNLMPAFCLTIQNVEGNLFRFEEELIKLFPTKKIFVRSHTIYVYNVAQDGKMVLHHWLLGLGF